MRRLVASPLCVAFAGAFVFAPLAHLHKAAEHSHGRTGLHGHSATAHAHPATSLRRPSHHHDQDVAFSKSEAKHEADALSTFNLDSKAPPRLPFVVVQRALPPAAVPQVSFVPYLRRPRWHDPPLLSALPPRAPPV